MNEQASRQTGDDNLVRKTIMVAREQSAAFRIWTEQIHSWWPVGHSISGDLATRVILEGREGGRFYERTSAGQEHDWGRVLLWDPPHRLAFHWYLGSGSALRTRVEVQFLDLDGAHTEIIVEHRGPELIGDLWHRNRARYSAAWNAVLGHFGESS